MPNSPLSRHGTWRTYTTTDGLAGLQTEHIVEDRQGYLWFATCNSGVSRFDGDQFQTFTTRDGLCSDRVYAMCLDHHDRLWFGTWGGGVCYYDGAQFHQPPGNDILAEIWVTYLFADREGRLWCSGSGTLGYFDENLHYCDMHPLYNERYEPIKGQCRGIVQDATGDIWFGFRYPIRFDGSTFHRYDNDPGKPAEDLPGGGITTLGIDAAGAIWTNLRGQKTSSLWRYDGEGFAEMPLGFTTGLRKFELDRDGRLWGCTLGDGVFYLDAENQTHRFTPEDGLAYGMVNHMHQDREGQYWFATWGGGVSCYDPHSLHHFDHRDGIPGNEVATLAEDGQGHTWMHSFDGLMQESLPLAVYDGQCFTKLEWPLSHLAYRNSTMYTDDKGQVWMGIYGKNKAALLHTAGHGLRTLYIDEGPDIAAISAFTADAQGQLIVGKYAQEAILLVRYDGQTFQPLGSITRQATTDQITALAIDADGTIWFSIGAMTGQGEGIGIGRLNTDGEIILYTYADGLIDNRVNDLHLDRHGRIWCATFAGLSCFDGQTFTNFTTTDGLPSNQVRSVCEDRNGTLWFGTEAGVVRYDGQTFQPLHLSGVTRVNQILEDRDGKFWFGTSTGAYHYAPSTTAPGVRIVQTIADQIYADDTPIELTTTVPQIIF